jgi:hypothetical protein
MAKFKAKDHKGDSNNFEPIPAGEYTVALVKSEKRDSQTIGNKYLNLQFTITEGEHARRIIFMILNLKNSNEIAQKIAEENLAAFMNSAGVPELQDIWDLSPLLNKEVRVRLKIRKSPEYGDSNEIAAFLGTAIEKPKKKGKKKKGKNKSNIPF